MSAEPWDVPVTAEGRETLIRLAEQYEADGKTGELAWTMIRLAHVLKWVGSGREGVDWHGWRMQLAQEALNIFRQIDDKAGIATALRISVPAFAPQETSEPILQEALAVSTEIGDQSGRGWALFALGNGPDGDLEILNEALVCFEAASDKGGMAAVFRRRGVRSASGVEFLAAADLYAESGDLKESYRTLMMATVFCRKAMTIDAREQIMHRALVIVQENNWPTDQYLVLRNLADLMKQGNRLEDRKRYLAEARKLKQFAPKFND